jgi:hypothetical protein
VLLGGPFGRELRGEAFKRARAYVADVLGPIAETPPRRLTRPAEEIP